MKAPNSWSCLATAYSIIFDQNYAETIKELGHDGSKIIEPNQPEPLCRRGFNIHEIIDLALSKGWAVTCIEANPIRITNLESYLKGFGAYINLYEEPEARFRRNLRDCPKGIITGQNPKGPHAIAWSKPYVMDPRTGQRHLVYLDGRDSLKEIMLGIPDFEPEHFWRFDQIKSP